jgi:hypothetical protein
VANGNIRDRTLIAKEEIIRSCLFFPKLEGNFLDAASKYGGIKELYKSLIRKDFILSKFNLIALKSMFNGDYFGYYYHDGQLG